MSESYYSTAQICLGGHVQTSSIETSPGIQAKFCKDCGKDTIIACAECSAPIRGRYNTLGVFGGQYKPPSYCYECGKPYPWQPQSA